MYRVWLLAYLSLLLPSAALAQLQPTTPRPSWATAERPEAERPEAPAGRRAAVVSPLAVWAPPAIPGAEAPAPAPGSWRPPRDMPTIYPPGMALRPPPQSWTVERPASAGPARWAPPLAGGPRSGSADSIGGDGEGPPPAPWRAQLGGRAAAAIAPWCPDGKCSSRAAAGGLGSHEYGGSQAASALCPGCGSRATIVQSRGRDGGDATYTEIQPPGEFEIPMTRVRSGVPARPNEENAARSGARWGATRSAFHTNANRAWGPAGGNDSGSGSGAGGSP